MFQLRKKVRPSIIVVAALLFSGYIHPIQAQKKSSIDTLFAVYALNGADKIQEVYTSLDAEKYDLGPLQLIGLGQKIKSSGKIKDALKVHLMNTRTFPKSSVPFFKYGDLLDETGDRKAAISSYKQGLHNLDQNTTISSNQRFFYSLSGKWGLKKLESVNLTNSPDFTYYGYHGGGMAGWWDTENMANFKSKLSVKDIRYKTFDLYASPAPRTIDQLFDDKEQPDVCSIFNGWIYQEQIESGEILPLDKQWDKENWDALFPSNIKRAVSLNKVPYMVPQAFQFNPIYFRKSVFDSLGLKPPTSWQGLLSLCDQIHEAGFIPFTISAKGWPPPVARWFTIINLRVNGFEFHRQLMLGKISWTDDRVKEVFDHWKQLFDHHAFAKGSENNSWTTGSNEFYSGKAVMYNIGEWIFESPNRQSLLNDIDFFTVPMFNNSADRAEIFHLYGTMMMKKGKDNIHGQAFLKFAASGESQEHNLKMLESRTPSNQNIYAQCSPLQKKQFDYIKDVKHLVPLFELNAPVPFVEFALAKFLEFWGDQSTIDKILKEIEDKRIQFYANVK